MPTNSFTNLARGINALVRWRNKPTLRTMTRPPILGGTGSATTEPVVETELGLYLDSGFLLLPEHTVNVTRLYQSPFSISTNSADIDTANIVTEPKPGNEVDGSQPPSYSPHTFRTNKIDAATRLNANAALHSTGLLRVYNQAKLGKSVSQFDVSEFFDPGTVAVNTGIGVVVGDGDYWLCSLNGDSGEAIFTKFFIDQDIMDLLTIAKSSGDLSKELKAESHALASATLTAETQTTSFSSTNTTNKRPVYGSAWAFNMDGTKAFAVLHECTGEYIRVTPPLQQRSVETTVVELTFTMTSGTWAISDELISQHEWKWDSQVGVTWVPAGDERFCPWFPTAVGGCDSLGLPTTGTEPVDIPICGHYVSLPGDGYKNNKLETAKITRTNNTNVPQENWANCASVGVPYIICNGTHHTLNYKRMLDAITEVGVEFSGILLADEGGEREQINRILSSSASKTLETLSKALNPSPPIDPSCLGPGAGCGGSPVTFPEHPPGCPVQYVLDVYNNQWSVNYTRLSGTIQSGSLSLAGSIVIPHHNRESVVLIKTKDWSGNFTTDDVAFSSPMTSVSYGELWAAFPQDTDPPSCASEFLADYSYIDDVGPGGGVLDHNITVSPHYVSEGQIAIFGRNSTPIQYEDTANHRSSVSIFNNWAEFGNALIGGFEDDVCRDRRFLVIQGVGPEIWHEAFISGLGENGFPESLDGEDEISPIGSV